MGVGVQVRVGWGKRGVGVGLRLEKMVQQKATATRFKVHRERKGW